MRIRSGRTAAERSGAGNVPQVARRDGRWLVCHADAGKVALRGLSGWTVPKRRCTNTKHETQSSHATQMIPTIVLTAVIGAGLWLYTRVVSPRPEFPPLPTSPDDPLLLEAMAKARASISTFLSLARQPNQGALVKLLFVSNSEAVEHLWADLLEVVSDTELQIRLVTPPVTHSGHLDRVYTCKIEDVEDWQVCDATGKLHGGFTQRALFAIARRDGVELPRKLLEQEKQYTDG
jgi:uncharacterized protein YegJ (DUF2314 family)